MKVKHIELIRGILLSGVILSSIKITADSGIIKDINDFLVANNISQEQIGDYIRIGYNLSLLTGFNLEPLCRDYKDIEESYKVVIANIAGVMNYLGIKDNPVKVFAVFVYLYRSGYLSYNKEFYYSSDMKDMASLCGADVVRGTGVCRSIASMFTDICECLGYSAANLSVNVKNGILNKNETLATVPLKDKNNGRKFARVVGKVTSIIPIGNHLVTVVDTNKGGIVFDPTNNVVMNMDNFRKYSFVNNTGAKMTYSFFSSLVPWILGQMDTEVNVFGLNRKSKKEGITLEQYISLYKEAQIIINNNQEVFEWLYEINQTSYQSIYEGMEKQHGLIKRVVPFIPQRKK